MGLMENAGPEKKIVLITGGAGFVGSHLCKAYLDRGDRVISLDNLFTGSRENYHLGVEYREGHTKDVERLVPETPDLIYHLGEYARVEKSFEDIERVWDFNAAGTFSVLEYWRARGCKLVYAGSSTKFADEGSGKNQSPYAWTKSSNTELVKNYGTWFNLPYAITYFYNVYGPGERGDAFGTVIEIFKQQYLRGTPLTVVSPGTQLRNFTHIEDTVRGLLLAGEEGIGDEHGIGANKSYSVLEVAKQFTGSDIMFLPERQGNRTSSPVDTVKVRSLGWQQTNTLSVYIADFIHSASPEKTRDKRVLVFTTTFYPVAGPAEYALCDLMASMPDVHFDIVTTKYTEDADNTVCPVPNATVYRVGYGTMLDKFFLPFNGAKMAYTLIRSHEYLFMWALMASYAALAAKNTVRQAGLPLLVTLADQSLTKTPWYTRLILKYIFKDSDIVHATTNEQEKITLRISERAKLVQSMGRGDAFANAIRFAYSTFLKRYLRK
jgi:UDP-glucose 4-epimerase